MDASPRLICTTVIAAALVASSITAALAAPPLAYPPEDLRLLPARPPHVLHGFLRGIMGSTAAVQTRTGKIVSVDIGYALRHHLTTILYAGRPIVINATMGNDQLLHAISIQGAQRLPQYWQPDH